MKFQICVDFTFLVLVDQNTVISIIRGNTIDKTVCDREIAKINKIIKNGKRIYFGGMRDALSSDIEELVQVSALA